MIGELSIGVCGWSLDRHDALRSIATAAEIDLHVIQLGFFTRAAVENADAQAIRAKSDACGVTICGAFIAFEGEDYSSISRIAVTGGLRPNDAYAERFRLTQEVAKLAAAVGATSLAMHAATISGDPTDSAYATLSSRVREVADALAEWKLILLLETGRESADTLLRFLDAVGRDNIAVNFDPANFIVYGIDDPVSAVSKLRGRIQLVHLKDASRPVRPGLEYGRAAAFGTGDVQIARVVSKLRATGYRGPLLLEVDTRESGLDAVRNAADYLRTMLA
ncbi:MAG: sugar phosphate isomerase/epimerase family protein [Phycisphaerales bacterium]|nr:sugar phosphate isomerase/epimerase family protein [Phycisphaerales bacterium]